MKSAHKRIQQKRFDALVNFLQKHPKYFPTDFVLSEGRVDKRKITADQGDTKNRSDDIFWEISQIRTRAISALMTQYNLKFEQIMALTISDLDLEDMVCGVRRSNGSVAYCLTLTGETADAISAYLRVRSPTKEDKLFLWDSKRL